jgi:L-asparagine transporter-like permease
MRNTDPKDELTRVRVALVINLMATLVSFLVVMNLMGTHATWRIILSSVGCVGFAFFSLVIYSRLTRLQKEQKQQEQQVS